AQFLTFQQLQGAFRRDFEQAAGAAIKLPVIEQQAATLLASLQERDAQIEAMRNEAQASAGPAAEAVAVIERQDARLADLARERDAAQAALEAARAKERDAIQEQTRLNDALARTEQEISEGVGLIEATRAELVLLGETLAQTRREAQERLTA